MPMQTLERIEKKADFVTRLAVLTAIFGVVSLLAIQIAVLITVLEQAETNGRLSANVLSCTTPGRSCFEATQQQSQRQLVQAEMDNLNATIAVLVCYTQGERTAEDLRACAMVSVRDQKLMGMKDGTAE